MNRETERALTLCLNGSFNSSLKFGTNSNDKIFTKISTSARRQLHLPFVSAVASLSSSAVVAGEPPVIYPLRTRHHDASHHNQSATEQTTPTTTSLQPSCCRRPLPQPVYSYRATDDLYCNQSTAVALQAITTEDPRRTVGAPQTQTTTTITTTATTAIHHNTVL